MLKIGLVLSGGGGKGAYEIGVWKALKELRIDEFITAVSGTSIGALNAVLFLQGNYELAESVWLNLSKDKIMPIDNKELAIKGLAMFIGNKNLNLIKKLYPKVLEQGNISREGLEEIMDKYIEFDSVLRSSKSCYATCSEVPELKSKYFKINNYDKQNVRDILLATSALPMIYESKEIENRRYIDGGISDNIPIQPLYGEGCDIIIVVHLGKEAPINKSIYPNTQIIEIFPSCEQGGMLSGVLDFTQEGARRRILYGYEDTMNLLNPILNIAYYRFKIELEKEKNLLRCNEKKKVNFFRKVFRKKEENIFVDRKKN